MKTSECEKLKKNFFRNEKERGKWHEHSSNCDNCRREIEIEKDIQKLSSVNYSFAKLDEKRLRKLDGALSEKRKYARSTSIYLRLAAVFIISITSATVFIYFYHNQINIENGKIIPQEKRVISQSAGKDILDWDIGYKIKRISKKLADSDIRPVKSLSKSITDRRFKKMRDNINEFKISLKEI
jgi:ribosomal protein S26